MTPLDFLKHVWPEQGAYCIGIRAPRPTGFRHSVFNTIEDAAAYVDKISDDRDVYFTPHVLKDATKRQKLRAQANMRACKVLFLDLDVEPDNERKYETQREAVIALVQFVKDTGLPYPMVVSSGYGVHVYWVLEHELDSHGAWLTYAKNLKRLALAHGLKIDPVRTTDQSSLLRVAGTKNWKDTFPRPVEVKNVGVVAMPTFPVEEDPAPPVSTELGSNTEAIFDKPPPTMVELLKSCAQMRRLAALRGNNSEPEWYWGDVGVVKFTENGRANVHKISSGYPGYSAAETDAKIDQWTKPPTTCKKLEDVCGPENAHLCQGCAFYGKGSSPAWVAIIAANTPLPTPEPVAGVVEQAIDPQLPQPYLRPKTGGVAILMESKEGKTYQHLVYPYDLYILDRSSNTTHETEQYIWRVHLPQDGIRTFAIEATDFIDDKLLQKKLINNGIVPERFSEMKNYMSAYVRELIKRQPTSVQHNQLGWIDNHTRFVLPTKILQPGGPPVPSSLSSQAAHVKEFVGTRGTLERQVELMRFYNHPAYTPNQAFIISSLGAMLFFATGQHGVIVNAAGEPGASKSTALYAAASMWGHPKNYVLSGTNEGATLLARSARRDILSNMPLCVDEITHIAYDVAQGMTESATQPTGRIRLRPDGTQRPQPNNERASMTLTTANKSLHSLLQQHNSAGTAGAVRVFEIQFMKLMMHEPFEAEAFLRGIMENYGWIGEHFAQAVVQARDKVISRVIEVKKQLDREASAQPEERFWFAKAACDIVACDLATRLKLLEWSAFRIHRWIVDDQLPLMRGIVLEELQSTTPASILMDYLQEINGDMIKVSKHHAGNISNVIQAPRGKLLAHYDMETRKLDVLKANFREYCWKHGKHCSRIMSELNKIGVVPFTQVQRVLGRGSSHAMGRSSCFTVDMDHKDIADARLPVVPAGLTLIPGGKK